MNFSGNERNDEEGVSTFYFRQDCNEIVIDDGDEESDNDKSCYICSLCVREFKSVEELYKHVESEFHRENKAKKENKLSLDLSKDETYVRRAKEEEDKWILENLCPKYGFGFSTKECLEGENVYSEIDVDETSEMSRISDEKAVVWKNDYKDRKWPSEEKEMRKIREKIHHPLEIFGMEFGVPSVNESLQESEDISYSCQGKTYCPKGRRVKILELEPVAKEEQVQRDDDERVTRLREGGVSLRRKPKMEYSRE